MSFAWGIQQIEPRFKLPETKILADIFDSPFKVWTSVQIKQETPEVPT